MIKSVEATGKTIEDAINNAYRQLGLDRDSDEASVVVLQTPKSGFLGIGAVPAKVQLSVEEPDPIEIKPEPPKQEKKETPKAAEPKPEQKSEQKQNRRGDKPQQKQEKSEKKDQKSEQPKGEQKSESKGEAKKEHKERSPKQRNPEREGEAAEKKERKERKPAEPVILTPEEQEKTIADATAFLTGLMERMKSAAQTRMKFEEDGTLAIELVGDDLGMLIGRRGETLNAIQHITSYVVNKERNERIRVTVDVEGYREKREDALRKLAHKTALKVVRYRRNISLEPMNAYERHVIHTALQDWRDVTTFSSGSEPRRCVVISYTPGAGGGAAKSAEGAEDAENPTAENGETKESRPPRRDDRRGGGRRGGRGGRGGNRGGNRSEGSAPTERPKPKPLEETIWE